jgi:hypothetical protein
MTLVEMEVTNENFPGRVFKGTAESVYLQMTAEKPELVAEFESGVSAETKSLNKRQGVSI